MAAVALVAGSSGPRGSLGIQLLEDLREAFGDAEKLSTETILTALHGLDESPWTDLRGKPLDARGLSQRLRKYDVRHKRLRLGDETLRGYEAADLADPWSRYLPPVTVPITMVRTRTHPRGSPSHSRSQIALFSMGPFRA